MADRRLGGTDYLGTVDGMRHSPCQGSIPDRIWEAGVGRTANQGSVTFLEEEIVAVLKRFPVLCLVLANMVALGVLASTQPAVAGNVDGCDEGEATGCGCLDATVWYPSGCYDHAGVGMDCEDDGGCEDN